MNIQKLVEYRSKFETVKFNELKDLLIELFRENGIVDNYINDLFTIGLLVNEITFYSYKNIAVAVINTQISIELNRI